MVATAGAGALLLVAPLAPPAFITFFLLFFSSTPRHDYITHLCQPHESLWQVAHDQGYDLQKPTKLAKWCVNKKIMFGLIERRDAKQESCNKSRRRFTGAHMPCTRLGESSKEVV